MLLNLITLHISSATENFENFLRDGLQIAAAKDVLYSISLFSSLNPYILTGPAYSLLDVTDPIQAFALTFSLHYRLLLVRDVPPDIFFYQSQLHRLVEVLIGMHVFEVECLLGVNQQILQQIPHWQFTLFNLFGCVTIICKSLGDSHKEPRRGSLLRTEAFTGQIENPFKVVDWFPCLYNFLVLSSLYHEQLRESVSRAFCAFVQLITIPKVIRRDLKRSISWFNSAECIEVILSSSFEHFLPCFCDHAIEQPAFMQAIADQFLDPIDFETDLQRYAGILKRDKAYSLMFNSFGALLALAFSYFPDSTQVMRFCAFKVIYHLLLFSFTILESPPTDAIAQIESIRLHNLSRAFLLPADLLLSLSSKCAIAFQRVAPDFVDCAFKILKANRKTGLKTPVFLGLIAPWFTQLDCNHSLLRQLVTASYRLPSTECYFGQNPLDAEVLPIFINVIRQRPKFVLNFLLEQETVSNSLCVFICQQFGLEMVALLLDHLRFDYWYSRPSGYAQLVSAVLEIVLLLIEGKSAVIQPFLPQVFVFCFIHRDAFGCCSKILEGIEPYTEPCDEILKWAISCSNIPVAMHACSLLKQSIKEPDPDKCDDVLNSISVVCHLLGDVRCTTLSGEIELIATLLDIAYLFGPSSDRLFRYTIEFLSFNHTNLAPIFSASLRLFEKMIDKCQELTSERDRIFFSLITAHFSDQAVIDLVFRILVRLLQTGFVFPDKTLLLFVLIPSLHFAPKEQVVEIAKILDPRVKSLKTHFDALVIDLSSSLSSEFNYLALAFFMSIMKVSPRMYFRLVFRISQVVIGRFARVEPVSLCVFQPLLAIIEGHQGNDEEARLKAWFQRKQVVALPEPSADQPFPTVALPLVFPKLPFRSTNPQTRTAHAIEKAVALLPKPKLRQMKEEFAVETEATRPELPTFNLAEILARIEAFRKQQSNLDRKVVATRDQLFEIRKIDIDVFRPMLQEVDAVCASDDAFPPLNC
jgi:hypothetical protein